MPAVAARRDFGNNGLMRENWGRDRPVLSLDVRAVSHLIGAALPRTAVASFHPTSGGLANTNLEVVLSGPPGRVLLRLYQRDPAQASKEAALNALVRQRGVPAARFVHFDPTNPITGQPYAVLEWVEGERLETVLPGCDAAMLAALARVTGRALASVHAIGFERPGFFGADLQVPASVDFGRAGLLAWLQRCLRDGRGAHRLGQPLTQELLAFAEREGHRLDAWLGRPCLVHADFNGSNLLVRRPPNRPWEVTAVLDWEFAFSGSPAFDFGNLLRPPLGASEVFGTTVVEAYAQAGGQLPEGWRHIAQIADLYAWADFLNRANLDVVLLEDARRIVRATVGAADECARRPGSQSAAFPGPGSR